MSEDVALRIAEADQRAATDPEVAYLFEARSGKNRVWLAYLNGVVIGGLRLTLESGATGLDRIGSNVVVHTVSIHDPYRGRGFGRALMMFAELWLQRHPDLPQQLSLAVEVDNTPAINLYESLDYEFLGAKDERLRTADRRCFVMAKVLSAERLTGPA